MLPPAVVLCGCIDEEVQPEQVQFDPSHGTEPINGMHTDRTLQNEQKCTHLVSWPWERHDMDYEVHVMSVRAELRNWT